MDFGTTNTNMYTNKREQTFVFLLVAVGIFSVTYGILFLIDFVPEEPKAATEQDDELVLANGTTTQEDANDASREGDDPSSEKVDTPTDPLPTKIIFDKFDREVSVLNPQSRDVAALDEALLSGVVRHPDSANFENEGTMFLFGHSSYLPHVINKNYQAFNGIQELTWGDKVRVQSADTEYVYRVDRVYQVRASEAEVAIERGTPKLTLATCNSFGSKDDRYIVEAVLIEEHPLDGEQRS